MKILCLVDKFYPDSSANTVCCENIAECFKLRGHQVDIATIKWDVNDKTYDVYNGSNIIKLDTYWIDILKKKGKKYNATRWSDFPWFFRKFNSLVQKIKHFYRTSCDYFNNLDCINYNHVLETIQKINNHYDILITIARPFTFQIIGKELMERNLADKWYPLFLDAFVYNKTLKKSKIKFRKKLTEKILKNATHVFMVEGIKGENLKNGFNPDYHNKTTEIYLPMLKEIKILENKKKKSDNIILLYAGIFYHDIRNPESMLNVLSKLDKNCEIKLFCSDCEDIIENKKALFKECKLTTNGLIPHDVCLQEISNADILINLGNSISNQMPSKILEYISFGKPIVNFYFTEEDMCLPILKKYPLSININLNNYNDEDIKKLKDFVRKNKGIRLSFDEATKDLVEYKIDFIFKIIDDTTGDIVQL